MGKIAREKRIVPDQKSSQFSEDNRDWLAWTIRDEIYGFVRQHLGSLIVGVAIAIGGAVWAFHKEHPLVWEPIVAVVLTLLVIVALALIGGRKRKRTDAGAILGDKEPNRPESGSRQLLTTQQLDSLASQLSDVPRRELHILRDSSSVELAAQLQGFFANLGWTVPVVPSDKFNEQIPPGIRVRSLPEDQSASLVRRILSEVLGFPVGEVIERAQRMDWFEIEIGRKPSTAIVSHSSTAERDKIGVGPAVAVGGHSQRVVVGARITPPGKQSYHVPSEEDLQTVYETFGDPPRIKLRFQSDRANKNEDALLLLLYGYRHLRGANDVPVRTLSQSLWESGCREEVVASIFTIGTFADNRLDVDRLADSLDPRFFKKHGLSRGGFYTLTDLGLAEATRIFTYMVEHA